MVGGFRASGRRYFFHCQLRWKKGGEEGEGNYHPASRESAAERMSGVSLHGLEGSKFDPIFFILFLLYQTKMASI